LLVPAREKEGKAMPWGIARFRVEDYDHWKRVRDENVAKFREAGFKSQLVFRNPNDSHEVLILSEADGSGLVSRTGPPTLSRSNYQYRSAVSNSGSGPPTRAFSLPAIQSLLDW
jgi:hypothetical protein